MVHTGISDEILILESDVVDTIDTLLEYEEIEVEETSLYETVTDNFSNLEKISLDEIAYNLETDTYFNPFSENQCTEDEIVVYNTEDGEYIADTENFNVTEETTLVDTTISFSDFEEFKNELLEPLEILNDLDTLREKSKNTVKKLRELKTMCEQAIVDLEHKIEFEDFTIAEGHSYSLLIKELRMKRRFIKNTLDRYDSVSQTLAILEKNLGKNFIKQQIRILNKVSTIQSNRRYTPRILKNLEINGKACAKSALDTLEVEIASILETANA